MEGIAADLHLHTTFSDGVYSPAQLRQLAGEAGLAAIAITDHDATEGAFAAGAEPEDHGPEIIPGVELSVDWEGKEIHILGYFLSPTPTLVAELARLRRERRERGRTMVRRLAEVGVDLSLERLESLTGENIGRPHVARLIVEAGYAPTSQEAFARFLVPGKPGYVTRRLLTPVSAMDLLRQSGGVPVFAHPGLVPGWAEILPRLVELGLLGLEVRHPGHPAPLGEEVAAAARTYGLLVTGGSDFHGSDRGEYGAGVGEAGVTVEELARLREAAR